MTAPRSYSLNRQVSTWLQRLTFWFPPNSCAARVTFGRKRIRLQISPMESWNISPRENCPEPSIHMRRMMLPDNTWSGHDA